MGKSFVVALLCCLLLFFCRFLRSVSTESTKQVALKWEKIQNCTLLEYTRPLLPKGEVLNVTVGVTPYYFLTLDEREQVFAIYGDISLEWYNNCTKWKRGRRSKWRGIYYFSLQAVDTWIPEVDHINSATQQTILTKNRNNDDVYYMNSGKVIFSTTGRMEATCPLSFKKFPFDSQRCTLILESFADSNQVRFNLPEDGFHLEEDSFMGGNSFIWRLVNVSARVKLQHYKGNPFSFYRAYFTFTFVRRPEAYYIELFLSSYVLNFLILSSVIMPPNLPQRAVLSTTVELAYIVFRSSVHSKIPMSPDIPYISIFMTIHQTFGVVCIIYSLIMVAATPPGYNKLMTKTPWGCWMSPYRFIDCVFAIVMLVILFSVDAWLIYLMNV